MMPYGANNVNTPVAVPVVVLVVVVRCLAP